MLEQTVALENMVITTHKLLCQKQNLEKKLAGDVTTSSVTLAKEDYNLCFNNDTESFKREFSISNEAAMLNPRLSLESILEDINVSLEELDKAKDRELKTLSASVITAVGEGLSVIKELSDKFEELDDYIDENKEKVFKVPNSEIISKYCINGNLDIKSIVDYLNTKKFPTITESNRVDVFRLGMLRFTIADAVTNFIGKKYHNIGERLKEHRQHNLKNKLSAYYINKFEDNLNKDDEIILDVLHVKNNKLTVSYAALNNKNKVKSRFGLGLTSRFGKKEIPMYYADYNNTPYKKLKDCKNDLGSIYKDMLNNFKFGFTDSSLVAAAKNKTIDGFKSLLGNVVFDFTNVLVGLWFFIVQAIRIFIARLKGCVDAYSRLYRYYLSGCKG